MTAETCRGLPPYEDVEASPACAANGIYTASSTIGQATSPLIVPLAGMPGPPFRAERGLTVPPIVSRRTRENWGLLQSQGNRAYPAR